MSTPAKNAKEMSPAEFSKAKQDLKSGKAPPAADGVKTAGSSWGIVASHVRAMSTAEIQAFKDTYGINITIDPPKER